jgi:hypothetical protein
MYEVWETSDLSLSHLVAESLVANATTRYLLSA